MMKKLLAITLVSLASTSAMASYENAKMVSRDEGISHFAWSPNFNNLPMAECALNPKKPRTEVYYVNKFRKSSAGFAAASDPVMLDCNGVLTLINPGSSAVCNFLPPAGKEFNVCIYTPKELNRNGVDGVVVTIDE